MDSARYTALLAKLGFTENEALAYLALLGSSPQTGYGIARITGKSRANVYQALSSLEAKRAVVRLEGTDHGEFVPVPIGEYAAMREREFALEARRIAEELQDVGAKPDREGIIAIRDAGQLYERAEILIREARSIILVDTDPGPLSKIRGSLEERSRQGLRVLVETPPMPQENSSWERVELRPISPKDEAWPADWLCLGVDGSRFLISLLEKETGELIYGLWSGDAYVSPWICNGILHEMAFRVVMRALDEETDLQKARSRIHAFIDRFLTPEEGFRRLQRELGALPAGKLGDSNNP